MTLTTRTIVTAAALLSVAAVAAGCATESDNTPPTPTPTVLAGPWQNPPNTSDSICLPLDLYPEIAMGIGVYELPKNTSITITDITPVEADNLVVDGDYRLISVTDQLTMAAGQYPPIKPFTEPWETAGSPIGVEIDEEDLPVAVVAHITPSGEGDSSLEGFNVTYTSDGETYELKTPRSLEVHAEACDDTL